MIDGVRIIHILIRQIRLAEPFYPALRCVGNPGHIIRVYCGFVEWLELYPTLILLVSINYTVSSSVFQVVCWDGPLSCRVVLARLRYNLATFPEQSDTSELFISDSREGGRDYLLRPSFEAMTRIGTPEEIVQAYATIHGNDVAQLIEVCAGALGRFPDWLSPSFNRAIS